MKYVKLGIELSYLLRHNKEYSNVISDDGYLETSLLLNELKISLDDLKEVVGADDNGRFEFNIDYSRIRAKYGHSIWVNLNTGNIVSIGEEGLILYHGTTKDVLYQSIIKEGLKPMKRKYIHLTTNEQEAYRNAARFKNKEPVVLEIRLTNEDTLYYNSSIYLIECVSPDKITILNYFGTK